MAMTQLRTPSPMNSRRSLLGTPKLRCVNAVCNRARSAKECPSAAVSVDNAISGCSVGSRTLVIDHQADIGEQWYTFVVVERGDDLPALLRNIELFGLEIEAV